MEEGAKAPSLINSASLRIAGSHLEDQILKRLNPLYQISKFRAVVRIGGSDGPEEFLTNAADAPLGHIGGDFTGDFSIRPVIPIFIKIVVFSYSNLVEGFVYLAALFWCCVFLSRSRIIRRHLYLHYRVIDVSRSLMSIFVFGDGLDDTSTGFITAFFISDFRLYAISTFSLERVLM